MDISKIQLDGGIYNIKDSTARNEISKINGNFNPDVDIAVCVGDSYGANTTNWVTQYANINGLTIGSNLINACVGNAGFHDIYGGNNTYLNNLQSATSSIDKTKVKKIIVAGGYNDRTESATTLETLVSNFISYCKTNFPKAQIFIGMIGNEGAIDPYKGGNINFREWLIAQVLKGYKTCEKYGAKYLNGVETVMHHYDLFATDWVHPNLEGCKELAKAISQAELGNYTFSSGFYEGIAINSDTITPASSISNINMNIVGLIENNIMNLRISGNISFSNYQLMNNTDDHIDIEIGSYTTALKYFRHTNYLSDIPCIAKATMFNATEIPNYNCLLMFTDTGKIILRVFNNAYITRYISALNFITSYHTLPLICQ